MLKTEKRMYKQEGIVIDSNPENEYKESLKRRLLYGVQKNVAKKRLGERNDIND